MTFWNVKTQTVRVTEDVIPYNVTPSADVNIVMQEQLDYLIEHSGKVFCGCSSCERYLRVKKILTEVFL